MIKKFYYTRRIELGWAMSVFVHYVPHVLDLSPSTKDANHGFGRLDYLAAAPKALDVSLSCIAASVVKVEIQ